MGKGAPPASESFLQVFDGSDPQLEAGSEGLWLGDAIAIELEQTYQAPFPGQENFEPAFEVIILHNGFLTHQRLVWLDIRGGNKLNWTNQIGVEVAERSKIVRVG